MRILVATAVPVERDAVARAFEGTASSVDVVAVGVGPALAAACTATALTMAAVEGAPYGLVVSAGIAGGFLPHAPVGSLVIADEITAADLGAETAEGFVPVTGLGFGVVTLRPPETCTTRPKFRAPLGRAWPTSPPAPATSSPAQPGQHFASPPAEYFPLELAARPARNYRPAGHRQRWSPSERDFLRILELLDSPPPPNEKLRAAIAALPHDR